MAATGLGPPIGPKRFRPGRLLPGHEAGPEMRRDELVGLGLRRGQVLVGVDGNGERGEGGGGSGSTQGPERDRVRSRFRPGLDRVGRRRLRLRGGGRDGFGCGSG